MSSSNPLQHPTLVVPEILELVQKFGHDTLTYSLGDDGWVMTEDGIVWRQDPEKFEPRCKVCNHPLRTQIELLYLRGMSGLKLLEHINQVVESQNEKFSYPSIMKHLKKHVTLDPTTVDWLEIIKRKRSEVIDMQVEPLSYAHAMIIQSLEDIHATPTDDQEMLLKRARVVQQGVGITLQIAKMNYDIGGVKAEAEVVVSKIKEKFVATIENIMRELVDIGDNQGVSIVRKHIQELQQELAQEGNG